MGLIGIFWLNALLLYTENILSWKAFLCQFTTGGKKNFQVRGDLKDHLVQAASAKAWERFTHEEKKKYFFYFIKKVLTDF